MKTSSGQHHPNRADGTPAFDQLSLEAVRHTGETVWTLHSDGMSDMMGPLVETLGFGNANEPVRFSLDQWRALQHPDDMERCHAALDAMSPETPLRVDYRMRDRNGDYIWVYSRGGVAETGADGGWTRATGFAADITDRKAREALLEASEKLIDEALISGNGGVWSMDLREKDSASTSAITSNLPGLPIRGGINTLAQWRELLHPDDVPISREARKRLLKGELVEVEYRLRTDDGNWLWVRNIGQVVERDTEGNPIRSAGFLTNISERKVLESRVAQTNFQLAEALKAADLAAWRYDLVDHVSTIRGDLAQRLGVDQNNPVVPGEEWMKHVHPDDKGDVIRRTMDVVEGKAERFESLYRAKDSETGEWRWIRSSGRLIERTPDGKPKLAAGVLKDETSRIQLETELQTERDRYRSTYRATPAMMHTIDRNGVILNVSDYWLAMMEYTREEVIGTQASDYLVEEDRERARTKIQPDFWRTGVIEDVPYRFRTKSGAVMEILLSAVVEKGATEEADLAHGILVDVTERNELNRALVEEKNRFESIYRATPAMMHTINADGRIIQVSDYWLSVMGYERREVIGQLSTAFLDPESRERAVRYSLPRLFREGGNHEIEYRFVTKSGEKLDVLLNSFLERAEDGSPKASYAVITDITPLRRAYEGLKRSNRELDRFAAVASHDLQEPLRKVAAFASLMRRRYSDQLDEEGRRCLDFMSDGAQRMQLLIDDLLTYSRLGNKSLRTETFELSDALTDALKRLEVQIEETGATVIADQLGPLEADRPVITQILQNLVSNALKYRGVSPPRVDVRMTSSEDGWTISVADNGIGFEPRFAEKIFAPFQRLHSREEYPGTGIGLSIVQQGVERHGGRVDVSSTPGKGATFTITLPRRAAGETARSA